MFENLRPAEVVDRLRDDPRSVLLLDVREPYERTLARIEPSLHIPMSELSDRIEEIPKDRDLIVYCHSGSRSMMVAAALSSHGYRSVANLDGGIDAWSVEVDPAVPRYD